MKVLWPFGVALRGEMSSHLMLHWLKTVVVSDEEKAAHKPSGRDQEGERKRSADEASKNRRRHQNRGICRTSGRAWREPVYWPGGVRCEGGASLVCGYYMERGKACADTAT
jgi:hypothetical protein